MTRVLVVDDEPQIRRALDINLRARGYEVDLAPDGERALEVAAKAHPDVVVLDLGLPGIDGVDVIRGLRGWSQVPIVVLSQLSRAPESRSDHRPQLSDLRESGALEQDADVVILLYREDAYNRDPNHPDAGTAELILAKQRNGPTGLVRLAFLREQTRFANLAASA